MKFKSSYGFHVMRCLVLRIDLAPAGSSAHLSESDLARSLSENYPFYKMKVKGDIATFSGLDGDGDLASFDFTGAREYRHIFGALVDEGGPVVVQLGLRRAAESDPPHLRVVIDQCDSNFRNRLVWLMRDLADVCGEPEPFDESRITVERIDASFLLNQKTIEQVQLAHRLASAGALETMIDGKGRVCGYQIGRYLDPRSRSKMPRAPITKQVKGIAWTQTREFSLRSLDIFRDGHPGVWLRVQLHGAFGLKTLGEKNLLTGLELEFRDADEADKRVWVEDWNIWESWARIVLEISAVAARE